MSTHYPTLNSVRTAACDHCGAPAVEDADSVVPRWHAYRQAEGFVFLCAACVPEHHAAYHATRCPDRRPWPTTMKGRPTP